MPFLVTLKGPQAGRQYPLDQYSTVLGRQTDSTICLESQAVSRHHARILSRDGNYFIEDLHSSNGTFVNGKRVRDQVPFKDGDNLQVGPYYFSLRQGTATPVISENLVIREKVSATPSHHTLHGQSPSQKLQAVLEISQHLARTLDIDVLFGKLLDHLMGLFPQADRSIVLLCEADRLIVGAQRSRLDNDKSHFSYSRTVVKRALEEGVGILSDDARSDDRFQVSSTVTSLDLRSLMCVPLISQAGKHLGAIQLDSLQPGRSFQIDDLQVLTAIGMQVAVVLENAALHSELLREERLRHELALAKEIQQGFLPTEFPLAEKAGYELYARVISAREVSGDFYDFFTLPDKRLAFFVGDISGKGMPAALFMVAVRTLGRHLAKEASNPAETLAKLNTALATDNVSGMFATLVHGLYEPATGQFVLATGGHPAPLVRRASGSIEQLSLPFGQLIGYVGSNPTWFDYQAELQNGDMLVAFTDGLTEARRRESDEMFGVGRLAQAIASTSRDTSLVNCCDQIFAAVEDFSETEDLQDDQTLLLIRRVSIS